MGYVVFARKYRPNSFAELIGQEPIVRTLRNAMASGRVHHAFVLAGTRGVGKTTTARLLAKGLNCERGMSIEPCNACSSCRLVARGEAPAVLEVDGASNTGVDHVRDLRESARYQPAAGRFKIFIVDEVHMLSQAAFNALLKLLEEPPPHVKFIFATTEPHKLPDTMLSRCQRFDFRRVRRAALADLLGDVARREMLQIAPSVCQALADQAEGSVRDALSLLEQVVNFAGDEPIDDATLVLMGAIDRTLPSRLTDALLARDAGALLTLVDQVDRQGFDFAEVLRLLLMHVRHVAIKAAVAADHPSLADLTEAEHTELARQGQQRGQEDWQRMFEKLAQVAEATSRSSVPKATCELGLLRLMQIRPSQDIAALLEQVDTWLARLPAADQSSAQAAPDLAPRTVAPQAEQLGPQLTKATECAPAAEPLPRATPPSEKAPPAVASAEQRPVGQLWRTFVDRVSEKRPSLASLLEHAHVLTLRPGEAQIALPAASFSLETVRDSKNLAFLAAELGELMGMPSKLTAVPQTDGAAGQTLADERAARAKASWQTLEASARSHPIVKRATELFAADIAAVRPEGTLP